MTNLSRLLQRFGHLRNALAAQERGQAAVEYAIMSAYLLTAGVVAYPLLLRFAPNMINALQIYVDGFYFVFSLPIP